MRRVVQPNWMTRDMLLVITARVFMSAARALAGVITPIYLALIGFSALQLGALFTTVALTAALLSTSIGLISDRVGRKPFLVGVPLLAACAAVAFAYTRAVPLLYVFAALGSFGRGAGAGAGAVGPYQPAEQAYLAGTISSRFRNSLFGRVAFASSLGALIGGPLATLPELLPRLGFAPAGGTLAYRPAFLAAAALAVAAGLLALPIVEHRSAPTAQSKPATAPAGSRERRRGGGPVRLSRQTWGILWRLWVSNGVNGLAVGFFGPFITYWFYRRYGAGPATVGLLYTAINLAAMTSNLGAAGIARRLGIVRAIVASRALQAILMIPMVLAPTFWVAGAFYLLRMLAQRVGLPLRQSYVMGVVAPEERGRVGALSNLPSQATSALSPSFAGYLFDHVSLALPFEVGAALQGLNTLLFFVFFRHLMPPEERRDDGPPVASAPPLPVISAEDTRTPAPLDESVEQ